MWERYTGGFLVSDHRILDIGHDSSGVLVSVWNCIWSSDMVVSGDNFDVICKI